MPTTANLGLAVSSNQNDNVLEYWNKMLNESDGNFVILDEQFGILATKIDFTISTLDWEDDPYPPFNVKAVVTLPNTIIRDNSTVEAYFENVLESAGIVLYSVEQNGTNLVLTFYSNEEKGTAINGILKYVY